MQKPFPIVRCIYYRDFRHYYAYGNTPAEDLLRNVQPGVKIPSILLLGCGDLRSCFYTLWKNFRIGTLKRFDGVHFDLNDCSSAIIARDVLFLYLCLKMPQESESAALKNWISALWAIWFCHELYQTHFDVLKHNMKELIQLSRSPAVWSSTNNPLANVVRFSSPAMLEAARQYWIMWSDKTVAVKSVEQMNTDRLNELRRQVPIKKQFANKIIEGITLPSIPQSSFDKMESEIVQYLESGSVFVESINGDLPASSETFINLTFYERKDGKYSLHYESIPYRCFFHSHQFSSEYIRSSIANCTEIESTLLVSDNSFDSNPLLSNSIQQFSLWMRSSALVLQNAMLSPSKILFTFHHSDAIEHCLNLQSSSELSRKVARYDLIYTSNLIDHLTPTNLILAAIPLIKPAGYIFTNSLKTRSFDEYVQLLFGMDNTLLPIVLGIHCIDHEGIGYTSEISVEPVLTHKRMIIWEKVCDSLPLKHPSLLENSPLIVDALCSVFCNAIPSLLTEQESYRQELNALCTETVMHILLSFAERVECDTKDHNFWKPLVTLLMQKSVLKPYMHCIQTHSLLHGFHLHLVVDEDTCPLCKNVPVTDYLGQFKLDLTGRIDSHLLTPRFLILIHDESVIPENQNYIPPQFKSRLLQMIISCTNKPCHAIECMEMSTVNGRQSMHFYMPTSFLKKDYRLTVCSFTVTYPRGQFPGAPQCNLSTIVSTKALTSIVRMDSCYTFKCIEPNTSKLAGTCINSFGALECHTYDEGVFKTAVKLSDKCAFSLRAAPLSARRISSSKIEMCTGSYKFVITYPVPINYDSVRIKISNKNKMITVEAQRIRYEFPSENLLFFVNPSDRFTITSPTVIGENLTLYCFSQFSLSELETFMKCKSVESKRSPICKVRALISLFLQLQNQRIYVVNLEQDVSIFIIVEASLFDIEARSPCVHIAYSFQCSAQKSEIIEELRKISSTNDINSMKMSEWEVQLMKKVLSHFTLRTIIPSEVPIGGTLHQMQKQDILKFFSQAVVYPLYPTLLHESRPLIYTNTQFPKVPTFQCLSCGERKGNLKTCTGCDKAKYCGKECQKRHWKVHKKECKSAQTKDKQPQDGTEHREKPPMAPRYDDSKDAAQNQKQPKCSGCEKEHQSLRYCPCHKVAYCSQTCQRMDWVRHKTNCTKKK